MIPYFLEDQYFIGDIDADRVRRSFNIESYINIDRIERQRLYDSLRDEYGIIEGYDGRDNIAILFHNLLVGFKTVLEHEPNLDIYYEIKSYREK